MNTEQLKQYNERRRSRMHSDSFAERGGFILICAAIDLLIWTYVLTLIATG